jgi:Flp pilus assembly CpaF family ATPase
MEPNIGDFFWLMVMTYMMKTLEIGTLEELFEDDKIVELMVECIVV